MVDQLVSAKQFWADCIGYKYKLSNIQAALGCAQPHRIDELVSRKREILKAYKDSLSNKSELTLNLEEEKIQWSVDADSCVFRGFKYYKGDDSGSHETI